MTEADKIAHPWPLTGWIEFRLRRAVWISVRPWYKTGSLPSFGIINITRMFILRAWFPFLTYNFKIKGYGIHGYIGWKPIPVANDPAFMWRDLFAAQQAIISGELFVQLSARGGIGKIS